VGDVEGAHDLGIGRLSGPSRLVDPQSLDKSALGEDPARARIPVARAGQEVHRLGAELSLSTRLVRPTDELTTLAAAAQDDNPHRNDEPYRQALVGIYGTSPRDGDRNGMNAINRGFFLSAVVSAVLVAIAAFVYLPGSFAELDGGTTSDSDPRLVAIGARLLLLVTRAIPPPVWALLVLFVLFPGPLPGAVALGIYNFGILGRLMAEVVENLDPRPGAALRDAGAGGVATFAYATLPLSLTRFTAYSLYRWEVAVRETVVVGVVGAGGLGRLLEQQRASFNYPGMLATVMALVAVSIVVDLVSASARRSLR